MVQFWRAAGLTYTQYSRVAAQAVRQSLKEPARTKLARRDDFDIQKVVWSGGEAGKLELLQSEGVLAAIEAKKL